ncbi:MAG: carbohydrate kinase family protein [Chloroflexota bacterium]|nr:carbohydrate kinase family protein [Chloroflexota bacterium]
MGGAREVLVIGDALLDVTVQPAAPMRAGADVPAEIRVDCGGQGANLAVRLARQRIDVELVCGLGEDHAGSLVTDALRAEGVVVSPVPAESTGTVVILLDEVGERTMLSRRAPFAARASALPADWTLVSGYLFLEEEAATLARTVGDAPTRRVVVGCAVPQSSRSAWRAAVAAMHPDLLILNRDEALALDLTDAEGTATVITAADVVVASIGDMRVTVQVPPGARATDTTGAGDAFAAGLVAELRRTAWPPSPVVLEGAMTSAVALASQVARVPGAQARVPAEGPA